MIGTARGSTGFVWVAAGAAMILSVAALAQNASADARVSGLAMTSKPAITEPHEHQERQRATPTSDCGGGIGRFLNELISPPNPFGSACDLRGRW